MAMDQEWKTILKSFFCVTSAIQNLIKNRGFGDPEHSRGGDFPTVATWELVCDSSNEISIVWLTNTGGNEIEVACNESSGAGFRIAAASFRVIDNFKGRVYARSVAGASILNWYAMPLNLFNARP